MIVYINPLFSGQRPAFAPTFPVEKDAHRKAQSRMFGAAGAAGLLPKTKTAEEKEAAKAAMLSGINQLLGLRLESRTQLTVPEMEAITVAIEAGAFFSAWKLVPGFSAQVKVTISVDISEVAADYITPDHEYAGYEEHFYQL